MDFLEISLPRNMRQDPERTGPSCDLITMVPVGLLLFLYQKSYVMQKVCFKLFRILHSKQKVGHISQSYDFCKRLFFTFHFTELEVIFFMTMHFIIEYIRDEIKSSGKFAILYSYKTILVESVHSAKK